MLMRVLPFVLRLEVIIISAGWTLALISMPSLGALYPQSLTYSIKHIVNFYNLNC